MIDLPFVWGCLIALAVLLYVVLDGFDLGIGILFPLFKRARDRDTMMNSIAPVWDGNETWLVLGGGGLLAAFPLAYAIVLPALYDSFPDAAMEALACGLPVVTSTRSGAAELVTEHDAGFVCDSRDIDAGVHGHHRRLAQVVGQLVTADQFLDGEIVALDRALVAPLLAQDLGQQPAVGVQRLAHCLQHAGPEPRRQ